jgi:transcription antitermination protein NusB
VSRQRSKARSLAVQAVYQWQMAGQGVQDIVNHFLTEHAGKKMDVDYFRELVEGVPGNLARIDEGLAPHVDRSIQSVDPVERAILRIGAYELLCHPEIPYRVVINEAIELAKVFGAEQGHRYVNGVLDKAAKTLRPLEMAAERKTS